MNAYCSWSVVVSWSSQLTEQGNICVCANPFICTYLKIFLYIFICIYIKLNMKSLSNVSSSNSVPHGSFLPPPLTWLWPTTPSVRNLTPIIYIHLFYSSVPVYIYSGFRIVNLYPHGKHYQLQYCVYVQFLLSLVYSVHSFPELLRSASFPPYPCRVQHCKSISLRLTLCLFSPLSEIGRLEGNSFPPPCPFSGWDNVSALCSSQVFSPWELPLLWRRL